MSSYHLELYLIFLGSLSKIDFCSVASTRPFAHDQSSFMNVDTSIKSVTINLNTLPIDYFILKAVTSGEPSAHIYKYQLSYNCCVFAIYFTVLEFLTSHQTWVYSGISFWKCSITSENFSS